MAYAGRGCAASAVVALIATIAGCGGGRTLTHRQLVERADSICNAASARARALPRPTSVPRIIAFVDQAAPVVTDLQRRLSALKPSGADRARYEQLLRDQSSGLAALPKLKTAAETGNATEAQQAAAALAANPADRDARALGMTACAAHVSPQG
jgi:hypothetical protein